MTTLSKFAQLKGRGRVFVQEIVNGRATVRFDAGLGVRGPQFTVPVSRLDFSAPDGWKVLRGSWGNR